MSYTRPHVIVIAAVARNGVIGRDGGLPWHIRDDMLRFKALTAGCPVVMGRRTWESLPVRARPLPGRLNIVVTRQAGWRADGAKTVPSLEQALSHVASLVPTVPRLFVIGGAEIYAQALPLADELELTEVQVDVAGDATFPAWSRSDFIEVHREPHAGVPEHPPFDFVTYHRKR